jgi:undecaprenyl-diphosphatase
VGWLEAVVLGLVQGLTEFLPVSSSAHLRIVPALVGWPDPGAAFTAVIQLGTTAAVVVFFFRDLVRVFSAWLTSLFRAELRGSVDARLGWYIILGTIPIAVVGLAFKDQIETAARNLWLISSALFVFSFVMLAADRWGRRTREVTELTATDGATIGLAQTLALIPGVSRSGSTISAGLFLGLTRDAAARYSFLLSIPAIVLSGLFELRKVGGSSGLPVGPTLLATVVAFVVGYISIAWLLRYLVRHGLAVFAAYRIAVALLMFGLLATGHVAAT